MGTTLYLLGKDAIELTAFVLLLLHLLEIILHEIVRLRSITLREGI